ncbi:hypothetical protein C8N46_102119 [Kordia periserrulae]|uniref:Uncharacterized protein n=1 Tax=Kordia periserrulae TaxID=701523 RepID=A0A2T6C320_9FLAO|nr:hypothetical protein [Kordia periserrulae]PTX62722.1 hypothetical protein C8N46_102119 [Kordia periserrulae]
MNAPIDILSLTKIIEEINSLDFFDEVESKVILFDETSHQAKEISTRKYSDLVIEIRIRQGEIVHFNHYLDKKFGNEFVAIWEKEILNRGLEHSVSNLMDEIVEDYKTIKFGIPKYTDIEQIVKSLYVFQIVTKTILRNGKLPMSLWNENHPKFGSWKKYFTIHPIVAGMIDAMIDEITKIPVAISVLYEIAYIETTEQLMLDRFFNLEVNKKAIEMYQEEEQMSRVESEYKAGKVFISVGLLLGNKEE